MLPISSVHLLPPAQEIDQLDGIVVVLDDRDEKSILAIAEQIKEILLVRHRGVRDFSMVVPINLLKEARESQKLFSLIMGTIAGLSLLVGGIGVMNVMLANIAEQTREIGLRMAVGASRNRIANLYLWNSILLTVSGGLWGLASGTILALAIQKYGGWDVAC
jgi:putative ABC transport system permease protein